jgi:hypothetical protein
MKKTIIGIDPGESNSGYCIIERVDGRPNILEAGNISNEALKLFLLTRSANIDLVAIEKIVGMGQTVGASTFNTCIWIGRFMECTTAPHKLIRRDDLKKFTCGKRTRVNDSQIRSAVLKILEKYGYTSKELNKIGVTSHAWQATAVAIMAFES